LYSANGRGLVTNKLSYLLWKNGKKSDFLAERKRLLEDGLSEIPSSEFESFVTKVQISYVGTKRSYPQFTVHIPAQIWRKIDLKKGDMILVAVKRASEKEIADYKGE